MQAMKGTVRSRSGRPLDELTMDALRQGALSGDDFCISREQLDAQANAAASAGHPQLAENLRRAAELTQVPNERVFEVYAMLRPGRASYEELASLARSLAADAMPRLAAFVGEAAEAYRARGLTRGGP